MYVWFFHQSFEKEVEAVGDGEGDQAVRVVDPRLLALRSRHLLGS